MNTNNIEQIYNEIFGENTWKDDKDMYVLGAYFIEPNFNFQMGGISEEERDKYLIEYNQVINGELDAFAWLKEHGKISSNEIFAFDTKGNFKDAQYHTTNGHKEYYLFDDYSSDGIEIDIYVPTKADAIRVFNGEW